MILWWQIQTSPNQEKFSSPGLCSGAEGPSSWLVAFPGRIALPVNRCSLESFLLRSEVLFPVCLFTSRCHLWDYDAAGCSPLLGWAVSFVSALHWLDFLMCRGGISCRIPLPCFRAWALESDCFFTMVLNTVFNSVLFCKREYYSTHVRHLWGFSVIVGIN